MLMILFVLLTGIVIGKQYNDTLFLQNNDQVNINLDNYKGRRLDFAFAKPTSNIRIYHQDNQNIDGQTIKIGSDFFKQIINYPLIQSDTFLVGLTTKNDLIFLDKNYSMLQKIQMTSSNISKCHQVSWFEFPHIDGVLVLCEDLKNRFTFIRVTCKYILNNDGGMLREGSSCYKYYIYNTGLDLQACPSPQLTSQIESFKWLLIQCSNTVRMLRMNEVYYRDTVSYGYGEGPKYELRLQDVGSLMDAFKNINMQDIQKAIFTGSNTIAILDKIKGLQVAQVTYSTKIPFNVRLVTDLNFLPTVGEMYYTISFSLKQTLNNRIQVNNDKRFVSQSFIILSDLFLYEIVLQDTSSFNSTEETYQILVRDKINIRSKFQYNDQIQQIQIVYDTYYYYVCLNTVSSHNKCLQITRHRKRYDLPQRELLYEKDGQAPILIGVNNNYAISFNQTQILFFPQQDAPAVTVMKIYQNIVRLQYIGVDPFENELIITDKDNINQSSNYLIIGTQDNVPQVYIVSNPPKSQFASFQGDMKVFDHVRGPDINAQFIPQLKDQSQFLPPSLQQETTAVYTTSYVEGAQYALVDDLYSSTMKNSLYNQSFVDQDQIITVVQKSNFELSFIFFMLGQTTYKNITIVDVQVDAIQFKNKIITNIFVSRDNFVLQFKGSVVPEYLLINMEQQKQIDSNQIESFEYTFTQTVQSLDIQDKYQSYQLLNNIRYNNIFALMSFTNGTQCLVYQSLLKQGAKYQITLNKLFRDLDLNFLPEGIILASQGNYLYYLKLSKQGILHRYSTTSTQINIDQSLSSDFTFQVVLDQYYAKRPMLVIVTTEIYLYQLDNFQNKIDLLARLPRFDYTISSKQFTINQAMLIIRMESKNRELFYFTYDLTTTGQDRLYKSLRIDNSIVYMGTMGMTSVSINQYYFCLTQQWFILQKFTLICYQNKAIKIHLDQIANNEDHTNFNFQSQFSAFQSSVVSNKLEMQGSFYYQETLISKIDLEVQPVIDISKEETKMNPQNYFQGPVLDYSLQGEDSKYITLQPYIGDKNIKLTLDDNQEISQMKINEDFLVTMGDQHISVTKVAIDENTNTLSQSTKISYSVLNDILRSKNKPPVKSCKKIFVQPLPQGIFNQSHILSIVCTINLDGVDVDQLFFVRLAVEDDALYSFQNKMLFPKFLTNDLMVAGQNFINMKMINYIISDESFIAVTSFVSRNFRYFPYRPEDEDDLVAIVLGFYDKNINNTEIQSVRLREIGAQDFDRDRLQINDLQLICLQNCTNEISSKSSTEIAMFFNDLENCTLYFATLRITYDLTDLKSSLLELVRWSSMDIREEGISYNHIYFQVNQVSDQQLDISHINTVVEVRNDGLFVQVKTNSAAFEFTTDFDLKKMTKIDTIFRQYTECPNPLGSLYASLSDYLTISCTNNTSIQEYQNTYVKLFIRNQSQIETQLASVVQAIQIDDELLYINIQENQMGTDKFHLTTLEKINGQLGQLRLTTYSISNTSTIKLTQNAAKEEYDVDYCASNLYNSSAFVCSSMLVSTNVRPRPNPSYFVDFFLFVLLPLAIVMLIYFFGITLYNLSKNKRVAAYKARTLKDHLNVNDSYSRSEKKQSMFDSQY